MGKKSIVPVTYENERISMKNSFPYLKIYQLHVKSKMRAQKWMNPQSAAIAGSGNPLKYRSESEIRQKYFQNTPIRSPIHPLPQKEQT